MKIFLRMIGGPRNGAQVEYELPDDWRENPVIKGPGSAFGSSSSLRHALYRLREPLIMEARYEGISEPEKKEPVKKEGGEPAP